jgi:F0F1-type ATP synthase delta subunit
VNVHVSLDPQLISGVKIIMGDKVIDASARAQLAVLESTLRA